METEECSLRFGTSLTLHSSNRNIKIYTLDGTLTLEATDYIVNEAPTIINIVDYMDRSDTTFDMYLYQRGNYFFYIGDDDLPYIRFLNSSGTIINRAI